MEILLNDATLRTRMGTAGKQRIQDNFSIDRMVDDFLINYNKIITK